MNRVKCAVLTMMVVVTFSVILPFATADIARASTDNPPSLFTFFTDATSQVSQTLIDSTKSAAASTWSSFIAGIQDVTTKPAHAIAVTLSNISKATLPYMYGTGTDDGYLASSMENPVTRNILAAVVGSASSAPGSPAPSSAASSGTGIASGIPGTKTSASGSNVPASGIRVAGITEAELNQRLAQLQTVLTYRFASLLRNPNSFGLGNFAGSASSQIPSSVQNSFSPVSTFYGTVPTPSLQSGQTYSSFASAPTSASSDNKLFNVNSADQKVGVGTTSPQFLLDVDGTLRARDITTGVINATTINATSLVTQGQTIGGDFGVTGNTVLGGTLRAGGTTLSSLTLGSLTGPLQAINGVVSATSTLSTFYGGTGLSIAPTYGQLLLGNALGGYTLTSTSSLGITSPWTTSGTDIYNNNSGNVGIGTTSPNNFKLQVAGNTGPDANATYDLGSSALGFNNTYTENVHAVTTNSLGNVDLNLFSAGGTASVNANIGSAAGSFNVIAGGTSHFTIDTNGVARLYTGNQSGGITITPADGGGTAMVAANTKSLTDNGTNIQLIASNGGGLTTTNGGNVIITPGIGNNGTDGVSYFSRGNVGIGTANPSQKLEVDGGIAINNGSYTNVISSRDAGLQFNFAGGVVNYWNTNGDFQPSSITTGTAKIGCGLFGNATTCGRPIVAGGNGTMGAIQLVTADNSASWYLDNRGDAPYGRFDLSNGGSDYFTVLQNGNVGIGTTSPSNLLSVAADGSNNSAYFAGGLGIGKTPQDSNGYELYVNAITGNADFGFEKSGQVFDFFNDGDRFGVYDQNANSDLFTIAKSSGNANIVGNLVVHTGGASGDTIEAGTAASGALGGIIDTENSASSAIGNASAIGFKDSPSFISGYYSSLIQSVVTDTGLDSDLTFSNYNRTTPAGVERMRITSSGNVLIATTTQAGTLSVGGSGTFGSSNILTLNTDGATVSTNAGGLMLSSTGGTFGTSNINVTSSPAIQGSIFTSPYSDFYQLQFKTSDGSNAGVLQAYASGPLSGGPEFQLPAVSTKNLYVYQNNAGINPSQYFYNYTNVATFRNQGGIVAGWSNSTDGTRLGKLSGVVQDFNNIDRTGWTITTDGTNPALDLVPSGGNVGIGTANPNEKLSIVSADNSGNTNIATFKANNLTRGVGITYNGLTQTGSGGNLNLDGYSDGTTGVLVGGVYASKFGVGNASLPGSKVGISGNISIGDNTYYQAAAPTNGLLVQGNVGIGTTNPGAKLTIGGDTGFYRPLRLEINNVNGGFEEWYDSYNSVLRGQIGFGPNAIGVGGIPIGDMVINSFTGGIRLAIDGSPSNGLYINSSGNVGIGTTSPYALLSVAGLGAFDNISANSTTATSTFAGGLDVGSGAIQYDASSGITSIDNLQVGASNFAADSGMVSWIDMPVTSAQSAGTVESYSAQLNGTPILTVYGEADGSGGIQNTRIGIGTTSPSNTLTVTGSVCISKGTGVTSTCSTSAGTITANAFTTNTNVDLAENYVSHDPTITAGDLVMADIDNDISVKKAMKGGGTIIGVVSTDPGFLLGNGIPTDATTTPVALAGRVPVKVSIENGPIHRGDYLTISSHAGVAMKATNSGEVVGTALENAAADGTILVFIKTGFANIDLSTATSSIAALNDSNLLSEFAAVIAGTENWMSGKVSYMTGYFKNLFAQKVTTQTLCVGDAADQVCITKDQLKTILLNNNVSAASAPIPTPVPTSISTTTPSVSPTPSASVDPTVSAAPAPSMTPIPSATPSVSPTPTPTPSLSPTSTPAPSTTPVPTSQPSVSPISDTPPTIPTP